jgi:hypothetical protein
VSQTPTRRPARSGCRPRLGRRRRQRGRGGRQRAKIGSMLNQAAGMIEAPHESEDVLGIVSPGQTPSAKFREHHRHETARPRRRRAIEIVSAGTLVSASVHRENSFRKARLIHRMGRLSRALSSGRAALRSRNNCRQWVQRRGSSRKLARMLRAHLDGNPRVDQAPGE